MKAKILVYALPALILAAIHLAEAQQADESSTDRLSRFKPLPRAQPAPTHSAKGCANLGT